MQTPQKRSKIKDSNYAKHKRKKVSDVIEKAKMMSKKKPAVKPIADYCINTKYQKKSLSLATKFQDNVLGELYKLMA